jgi:hypothetical protein
MWSVWSGNGEKGNDGGKDRDSAAGEIGIRE